MKTPLIVIAIVLLASCGQKTGKDTGRRFESVAYQNRAFILSDSIRIYNADLSYKTTVHGIAHALVNIDSMSLSKHFIGSGDTVCEKYNLVKIQSGKVNGWVFGKDVFEFTDKKKTANILKDTTFSIQSVNFGIYVLKNFGIGAVDDDGLTLCGENSPVALYNSKYKRLELVPVHDTGGTYGNKYMSLARFDGWMDAISHISYNEDALNISIERDYQEGNAHFDILILLSPHGSRGIVTRAREIVEHD
jgi:hypothetical protein